MKHQIEDLIGKVVDHSMKVNHDDITVIVFTDGALLVLHDSGVDHVVSVTRVK